MKTFSCSAPYGVGGLGRILEEVVDAARKDGSLQRYYAGGLPTGEEAGTFVSRAAGPRLFRWTPLRFDPGLKAWVGAEIFDRAVARELEPGETFVGFAGEALRSFDRARKLGYSRLELISPTSHVDRVIERHSAARSLHPIERSWLHERQRRKCVREYECADAIHVISENAMASFLDAGVSKEKLRLLRMSAHPRFVPGARPNDGVFRVVYVGSVTATKGVCVLVDAFERLDDADAQLTLVGGWATRGMRRWLGERMRRDPRISVQPGDPLTHLQEADVCVHPSWDDGFAFAAAEALACGVPVIVTEDTGMKDRVRAGVDGWIVPTGDADAILERLLSLRRRTERRAAGGW